MRLAAALVLAALLAVAAAVADEAVSAAYYEGRSGEILFKPAAWTEPSSFVSVMNKKLHAEHIDDVSVADLISHVSGRFLPINAAVDRTQFPSVNIFAPPMATVVSSISSLSTDDARMLSTMAGQSFTPVRGTSFPADPLARLTTMLTGATPSVHGIVGASWPTSMGLVTAYVSEFGQPRAANFPTLVSNAFSGKSLVLSASGSAQFSSAMNAMPDLIAMHTNWNNMQVFWNGDDIVTTSPAKKEHLNRKEIVTAGLASVALPANAKVEYDAATGALIVTLAKGVSAKFDLAQAADLLLVAELRIAGAVVALLEKNEAVRDLATDSIPDVIALSFVSLDAIKTAYGVGSVQARVALALIDAAIVNVNTAVAAVYNDALVSVLIGVAAPPRTTLPAALMQELIASNVVVAEPHPEAFLPAVYVHASAQPADEARLCATLTEMAAKAGVSTVCRFSAKHLGGARLRDVANLRTPSKREETVGASQHQGDISSEDVQVFHTVLWSSVLIALAIGGVIMVMCGIDTTKDTLLFRVSKSAHH